MKVVYPPRTFAGTERPVLFLAGSIEMDTASKWQNTIIQHLEPYAWTLLNPRRKDWDMTWKQSIGNPEFSEQVNWELNGIEQSDYVVFYFDPATKSPVTLLELGLAIGLGKKIFLACPSGFWRKGNVDITASRNSLVVYPSLSTLSIALQRVLPHTQKETK